MLSLQGRRMDSEGSWAALGCVTLSCQWGHGTIPSQNFPSYCHSILGLIGGAGMMCQGMVWSMKLFLL